jgi:hypothetical protein
MAELSYLLDESIQLVGRAGVFSVCKRKTMTDFGRDE